MRIQKRTRPKVDGLARDAGIVGVHHAVDKTAGQPRRNEIGLPLDDVPENRLRRTLVAMPLRGELDEPIHDSGVRSGASDQLERANSQVAGCYAHDDATRLKFGGGVGVVEWGLRAAVNLFAGFDDRQRAGGGDAERIHGFADEVLPQGGGQRGFAVTATGEGCGAGAFRLNLVGLGVVAAGFLFGVIGMVGLAGLAGLTGQPGQARFSFNSGKQERATITE